MYLKFQKGMGELKKKKKKKNRKKKKTRILHYLKTGIQLHQLII